MRTFALLLITTAAIMTIFVGCKNEETKSSGGESAAGESCTKTADCKDGHNVVLHEFAHLIVAPMAGNKNKELEEYTVSRLSQIFEWIRKAD